MGVKLRCITNCPQTAINFIMNEPDKFGMVINDVKMPMLNGINLAKKVRKSVLRHG